MSKHITEAKKGGEKKKRKRKKKAINNNMDIILCWNWHFVLLFESTLFSGSFVSIHFSCFCFNVAFFSLDNIGPHREMAVDVPDSFIARNKTPPRYPPPRPPTQTQVIYSPNGIQKVSLLLPMPYIQTHNTHTHTHTPYMFDVHLRFG